LHRRPELLSLRNEELISTLNGPETITLEASFALLGPLLLNRILWLFSMLMFNRLTATRLEDVLLATLPTLTVETLTAPMEPLTPAKLTSRSLRILPTVLGLFSGLGLEELSLWEIITHASIIKYLEDLRSHHLLLRRSMLVATTLIPDRTSASSSTPTDFTFASMSLAIRRSIPLNKRNLVPLMESPL